MGIYQIRNIRNNKRYIGSAAGEFLKRWREHKNALHNNHHFNPCLQNAWKKHGVDAFVFEVIEYVQRPNGIIDLQWKDLILEREQWWLDVILFANCNDNRFHQLGYNICRIAGSCLGIKRSKATRAKQSKLKIGSKHSVETRKKMSIARMGNQYALGFKHTKETRIKMSQARCGEKNSMYGKKHSDQTKTKMADTSRGRKCTKETRAKISKAQIGENSSSAKLTNQKVKIIKRALKLGITQKKIAKRFNISPGTISDIKTSKTWSHIK